MMMMFSTVFIPSFFTLYDLSISSIQTYNLLLQRACMTVLFLSPSLSVWQVLLVLEISADLTRGGFAPGGSFSLMREMELFSTCIRACGAAHVCSLRCLPVCTQWKCLSVYVCGFARLLVWNITCVFESLCVAVGFVFEHLCVRVSCLASPHTVSNFLSPSSYENKETEHFMWLLNTTFHFLTVCWSMIVD